MPLSIHVVNSNYHDISLVLPSYYKINKNTKINSVNSNNVGITEFKFKPGVIMALKYLNKNPMMANGTSASSK